MRNVCPRHTTPSHGSPAGMMSLSEASVGSRELSISVVPKPSSMWAISRIEHLGIAEAASVFGTLRAAKIVGRHRLALVRSDVHRARLVIQRGIERMLAGRQHHQRRHLETQIDVAAFLR